MTFREKLVDWISGGALTKARKEAEKGKEDARAWKSSFEGMLNESLCYLNALEDIRDMATPSMAHIGVRMVARATRALDDA